LVSVADVHNLHGGIFEWVNRGDPVVASDDLVDFVSIEMPGTVVTPKREDLGDAGAIRATVASECSLPSPLRENLVEIGSAEQAFAVGIEFFG